jgi:hypothetical protein
MVQVLLAQILEEPYPRINRKRTAAAAKLDDGPNQIDFSDTTRQVNDPEYRRIGFVPILLL